jgi:hypothetical protein
MERVVEEIGHDELNKRIWQTQYDSHLTGCDRDCRL